MSGKITKIWQNPKNHVVELEDGQRVSQFGSAPEELTEGSVVEFYYETKGEFKNYGQYKILFSQKKHDGKDNTLSPIVFGMIFNNAVHLNGINRLSVEENFDTLAVLYRELAGKYMEVKSDV